MGVEFSGIELNNVSVSIEPRQGTLLESARAHWDASDSDTIVLNSGNVSEWIDKIGNRFDFTQTSSSSQPLYDLNSVNNLNSVSFNGVNEFMSILNIPLLTNAANYEIHIVSVIPSIGAAGDGLSILRAGQLISGCLASLAGAARFTHRFPYSNTGGDDILSAASFPRDTPIVTRFKRDLPGNMTVTTNGITTDTLASTNGALNLNHDIFMGQLGSGARFFKGSLCEIIIFERSLSGAETTELYDYLSNKWGVS